MEAPLTVSFACCSQPFVQEVFAKTTIAEHETCSAILLCRTLWDCLSFRSLCNCVAKIAMWSFRREREGNSAQGIFVA